LLILIADDAGTLRLLLRTQLVQAGYEVVEAKDGVEALAILQGPQPPSLAILDWMMPGMDGIAVCRELRQGDAPRVHVILLTAKDDKSSVVEALDAGADDFLSKPFSQAELEARVRAGRRIVELQQDLRSARDALVREARHDPLTDAFNRRAIGELLEVERTRSLRQSLPFAVLFLDVDHFKQVNDKHGHAAGDAVLVSVVARLKQGLRPYDCIGRYGGEEFVVGLPSCDTARATVVAERLRQMIEQEPFQLPTGAIRVTASLGIASTAQLGPIAIDALLAAADAAVYRAKAGGRNCVVAA
jgi:two-component system cell cycle response regulator